MDFSNNPKKPQKILLASSLLSVYDSRWYEKIAPTLNSQGYTVFVMGAESATSTMPTLPITVLPHQKPARISWKRIALNIRLWQRNLQLRPDYLVIHSVDMAPAALFAHWFFHVKLIFDVQENTSFTILGQHHYKNWIKPFLAITVRKLEQLMISQCHTVWLAERGYEQEVPKEYLEKSIVVENKCIAPTLPLPHKNVHQFIFTGNLSYNSGVLKAIGLFNRLQKVNQEFVFTIIGYAPDAQFLQVLQFEIEKNPAIQLIGGKDWVPHEQILATIAQAQYGFVCYDSNLSNLHSIPTKVYEYGAYGVVMISEPDRYWNTIIEENKAGIVMDYTAPVADFWHALHTQSCYPSGYPIAHFCWQAIPLVE